MEGHTLADGFAEFPRIFPEIYRATVSAGEQAGHLDSVLERLADYTESREQMRQNVLAAMLYPIVLSIMCFMIVTALLVFVVPKVVSVFESSKAKLPLITRALIGTSDFLRQYGIYLLIATIIGVWAFRRWQKDPAAKRRFHLFQLRVPLVGKLLRGFNTARFTRTFSILSGSSVPVLEALRIAGEVVTNLPMRDAVAEASARVREGAPIGRSLSVSRLFPPMTIHLISSGESSGQLEQHARARRHQPGTRAGWPAGGDDGAAGTCPDRAHGRLRHGHRLCNAAADLPDEQPHPLVGGGFPGGLAGACGQRFTKPHEPVAVVTQSDLSSRRQIPAYRSRMSEKPEDDEFEDEDDDEPVAGDGDVDLDQVNKDLDLAKRRGAKAGDPAWRRLEKLFEAKHTAELTSDFEDYEIDIPGEPRRPRRKPRAS